MNDNKVIVYATIIFIILFIFFLSTRCEKITIGKNKLTNNYIRIYKKENKIVLSEFLEMNFITKNDEKYTLKEALNNDITTIDKINKQSTKKEVINDIEVYYFDKKSKINTKSNFKIVVCNENIIYIVSKFNLDNNICLKTIN